MSEVRSSDAMSTKIWRLLGSVINSARGVKIFTGSSGGVSGVQVGFDSTAVDAFNRLSVAQPTTVFDSKQLTSDNNALFYSIATLSGAGTNSTYSANKASTTLSVTALTAGRIAKQSKRWLNYQPGKAQLILLTHNFHGAQAGVIKRRGLYETNNGLFWQLDSDGLKVVQRSFATGVVVDTPKLQGSWNKDNLDGTGPSGFNLNTSNSAIYFIAFEWLGVGDTIFGVFHDRKPIIAHVFENTNEIDTVFMSTPNLPVRTEIIADGTNVANDSIEDICSTVISSGGVERTGQVRSIDRGVTALTAANNTSIFPVLSMRLKSDNTTGLVTNPGATVRPIAISIMQDSNTAYRWTLLLNPTVAGADPGATASNWVDETNSDVEYLTARTSTNTLTGGLRLASGYVPGGTGTNRIAIERAIDSEVVIGSSLAGVSDQLVLGIQYLTNPGVTPAVYGSIQYSDVI